MNPGSPKYEIDIGSVVRSRAGRDRGRYFVVFARLDDGHAAICDGALRKVGHPKKKKLMHLHATPERIEGLRQKLLMNQRIFDSEVREGLMACGYGNDD